MARRLGVGGRLLLAFIAISAFALLAAAAASVAFLDVRAALERITRDRVPATVASQRLSRQAERIAAAAPAYLGVDSPADHQHVSDRIAVELQRLDELLDALAGLDVARQALATIETPVRRLGLNLAAVDEIVAAKLALAEHTKQRLRDLGFADIASRRLMTPGIRVMDANLAELRSTIESGDAAAPTWSETLRDQVASIALPAPVRQARAEVLDINDLLQAAARAESAAELDVLTFPLRRSLDTAEALLPQIGPDLRGRLASRLAEFRELAEGPDGIIETRRRDLDQLQTMRALLEENALIASQLTDAVDLLVNQAHRDIRDADEEALSVQRTGTVVMATVVVLSLVCSMLIVWLYVGRSLVARLTALSASMRAIAGGDLDTPPPTGGTDEIGDMAKALAVFRDTALVVRETNLREIREARQRLHDAIESISEGFSLFDADDRLVLCNSRFHDLYPGLADVVVPGTPFETIVRQGAERGVVQIDDEGVEQWVAQRLARHRDPPEPYLQQQSDGRWIQVDERKIEGGGTVAVYTDTTALKRVEQELLDRSGQLTEKSQALEQLSSQLAKYLSPQVYDSIFSGRQEVRLASSRKKLTIFFSDIAGFTETTDRLEPEELTELLNQYLTEMSAIALEHGATVDKYIGDAMLVFFGDPETKGTREDTLACVRMAIAMRKRLLELEDAWRLAGLETPLRCRMGIHTDYCTVGNFGSENRMDYTIIGGGVNTASRLEEMARPGEILISYETFAQVREEIHCKERGEVDVRGIAYPVATYLVVDAFDLLDRERQHFHEQHPNARIDIDVATMTQQERRQAAAMLRRALTLLSDRPPSPTDR